MARVLSGMEHSRAQLLPSARLQRFATTYWSSHGDVDHVLDLCDWARDRDGLHHKEDQRIWVLSANEPASDSHAAEDKVDQRQEGIEQCVFLVLDDLRAEHGKLHIPA